MRAEEVEKEAKLFEREGECYIHVERASTIPFKLVVSGDGATVEQAIYDLMLVQESKYGIPFRKQLKLMRKAYRRIGDRNRCESDLPEEELPAE